MRIETTADWGFGIEHGLSYYKNWLKAASPFRDHATLITHHYSTNINPEHPEWSTSTLPLHN